MKLLIKKTGEIKDFGNIQVYAETENTDESQLLGNFDSFKQILEYYEDYIQPEPLIKNEKIRKAVRAWAEANNLMNNKLQIVPLRPSDGAYNDSGIICNGSALMSITLIHGIGRGLRDGRKQYTITELCGECDE